MPPILPLVIIAPDEAAVPPRPIGGDGLRRSSPDQTVIIQQTKNTSDTSTTSASNSVLPWFIWLAIGIFAASVCYRLTLHAHAHEEPTTQAP